MVKIEGLDFTDRKGNVVGDDNIQKAVKLVLSQVQRRNGTAIKRWRWLADPHAGNRRLCNSGQQGRRLLVGMEASRGEYEE